MRALVQRVSRASVRVRSQAAASVDDFARHPARVAIERGLCVLIGVGQGDGSIDAARLVRKLVGLRIFEDRHGKMNLSVQDVAGAILAISQFTLYADTRKGNRPSFGEAAAPAPAKACFDEVVLGLRALGVVVEEGVFGADMEVELVNDGPVTVWIDTAIVNPATGSP